MSVPVFTEYEWFQLPNRSTPVTKARMREVERKLAEFTEAYSEIHFRPPVKNEGALAGIKNPELNDVVLVQEPSPARLWIYNGASWKAQENPAYMHGIELPTWSVAGQVATVTFPGPFFLNGTNETRKLIGCWAEMSGGTKVEFQLFKGAAKIEPIGTVKIEAINTKVEKNLSEGEYVTIATGDKLSMKVTAATGTPEGLSVTALIERTVKATTT